jgi:hypothetical protein
LLKKVLTRYQRDYDRDRPGLVAEALSLIWAARRGLTENELLELLGSSDKPKTRNPKPEIRKLLPAIWNPLRSALEDGLVDRGGILNFAHDFLRAAIETAHVPEEPKRDELRIRLATFFEAEPVTARSCDELPWLLWQTKQRERLRNCILDIDRFLRITERDENELMGYWVWLKEERIMGQPYVQTFERWAEAKVETTSISNSANQLARFLAFHAALYVEAEPLMRRSLATFEQIYGPEHPNVGREINNLALLLEATNRHVEAEPLMRRALFITDRSYGPEDPDVGAHPNPAWRLKQPSLAPYSSNPAPDRPADVTGASPEPHRSTSVCHTEVLR